MRDGQRLVQHSFEALVKQVTLLTKSKSPFPWLVQADNRRKFLLGYVQEVEPAVMEQFADAAPAQVVDAMRQTVQPGAHLQRCCCGNSRRLVGCKKLGLSVQSGEMHAGLQAASSAAR